MLTLRNTILLPFLLMLALAGFANDGFAAQISWTGAAGTPDWFTAANWNGGVPTVADDAVINANTGGIYPWIMNGQADCQTLTVNPGAWTVLLTGSLTTTSVTNHGLLGIGGGTMTVNGSMTTEGSGAHFIIIAGTLQFADAATNTFVLGDAGGAAALAQVMGGAVLAPGAQVFGGSSLQVSGGGIFGASRDWSSAAGTVSQTGGILGVFGPTAATVSLPDAVLNFWVFKQSNATVTLAAPLTTGQALVVQEGVLDTGAGNQTLTALQDAFLNGGTLRLNAAVMRIGGAFAIGAGLFDHGAGIVVYDGAGNQNIAAVEYHDLVVDKPSGDATLTGSSVSARTLTVVAGSLQSTDSTWNITDTIDVQANGAAAFFNGHIYLGDANTYGSLVASGDLTLRGSGWNHLAAVHATDSNKPWSATITGALECEYFQLEDIAGAGVDCSQASLRALGSGAFSTTEQAGALLRLGAGTAFDPALVWAGPNGNEVILNGLSFDGDVSAPVANVEATTAVNPPVTFVNYDGALGGAAYENDPTSTLNWARTGMELSTNGDQAVEGGLVSLQVRLRLHPSPLAQLPKAVDIDLIRGVSSTATENADYTGLPFTVQFPAGSQDGAFIPLQIQSVQDNAPESLETLHVFLDAHVGVEWTKGLQDYELLIYDTEDGLIAITKTGIVKIDRTTFGARRQTGYGAGGFEHIYAMTSDPQDGRVYAVNDDDNELMTLNLRSGSASPIGAIYFNGTFKSLTVDVHDHELYALNGFGNLLRVDKSTGLGTLIGTSSSISGGAIASSPDPNYLYAVLTSVSSPALYQISKTSGAATLVTPVSAGLYSGLRYDDQTGELICLFFPQSGLGHHLGRLNTATGAVEQQKFITKNTCYGLARDENTGRYYTMSLQSNSILEFDEDALTTVPVAMYGQKQPSWTQWDPVHERILEYHLPGVDGTYVLSSVNARTGRRSLIHSYAAPAFNLNRAAYHAPSDRWLALEKNVPVLHAIDTRSGEMTTLGTVTGLSGSGVVHYDLTQGELAVWLPDPLSHLKKFTIDPDTLTGTNTNLGLPFGVGVGYWDTTTNISYGTTNTTPLSVLIRGTDLGTGQIVFSQTVSMGSSLIYLNLDPAGQAMYAIGGFPKHMIKFDLSGPFQPQSIGSTFANLDALTVDRNSGTIYAARGSLLYTLDEHTFEYTTLGPITSGAAGLAYDSNNDVLYGVGIVGSQRKLVTIDPATLTVTPFSSTLSYIPIDLAYDGGTDTLYGLKSIGPAAHGELVRFDLTNGSATILGAMASIAHAGISWDPVSGFFLDCNQSYQGAGPEINLLDTTTVAETPLLQIKYKLFDFDFK